MPLLGKWANCIGRKHKRRYTRQSMVKNLLALLVTGSIALSSTNVLAASEMHAAAGESAGILSVIRRALERKRTQPAQVSQQNQGPTEEELEAFHERVVERLRKRQATLEPMEEAPQEAWDSNLAETLFERHSKSIERRRERGKTESEYINERAEQRRLLREAEEAEDLRQRSEAGEERRAVESRREERTKALQEERRKSREELRVKRSQIAGKRDQYTVLRMELLEAVNEARQWAGVPPLTYNKNLELSAQLHAEDMLLRDYFDHFTPEGLSHVDRIKSTGYANIDMATCNCTAFKALIGENIAKGQKSVNWVMKEWMNSPSHEKNILAPYFTEIGIGIAENIWVQNFGAIELTPR